MLFGNDEELRLQPKRTKTLVISLGIHVVLIVFFLFNPDLLTSPPKRIIKVMGQDYDISKEEMTELVAPPEARPKPAVPDKPLVQPPERKPEPQPQQQAQQTPPPPQATPPPPPPPPPPKPQAPPPVIGPEDVIKEGARPDGQPKASRGNTSEAARNGSMEPQQPKPEQQPKPPQQAQADKQMPPIALNTNPNSLQLPGGNIMDSARRTVQQQVDEERRRAATMQGPRTGLPQGQEDPNFSTEEPTILSDTRGYDFGPYMNQVINRVRGYWLALIPETARLGKRGKVVLVFTITKNGTIANLRMVANSGSDPLDRAASGAISVSNPFAQLPAGFDGDHLDLQFTFLYNIR